MQSLSLQRKHFILPLRWQAERNWNYHSRFEHRKFLYLDYSAEVWCCRERCNRCPLHLVWPGTPRWMACPPYLSVSLFVPTCKIKIRMVLFCTRNNGMIIGRKRLPFCTAVCYFFWFSYGVTHLKEAQKSPQWGECPDIEDNYICVMRQSMRSFKILCLPIARSGMPRIPWQILCLQPSL